VRDSALEVLQVVTAIAEISEYPAYKWVWKFNNTKIIEISPSSTNPSPT
jgi:hypothetical protein